MIYAFEETGEHRRAMDGEYYHARPDLIQLCHGSTDGEYDILRPIPQAEIEAALAKIKAKDFGIERSKS